MDNYRLKRNIITDYMKQRMPALCEVEKPLKWWLSNNIVASIDDIEVCGSEYAHENSGLYLQCVIKAR